jgi:hypothetical protein
MSSRRKGDREIAAAIAVGGAGTSQTEYRAGRQPLQVACIQRRVRGHHDHAGSVAACRRVGILSQLAPNRRAAHGEHSPEIRLHQHSDRVAAVARSGVPRGSSDPALPAIAHRARTCAHAAFRHRSATRCADRFDDVLAPHVHPANIVQAAVIGFPNQGVDRPHAFVAGQRQRVLDHALHAGPHVERVGEDDRGFDGSEFLDLRGPGQLAERIAHEYRARDLLLKQVAARRHNRRHSGADLFALNQSYVAHSHARDIRDGIQRSGREDPGRQTQVAGPRPFGLGPRLRNDQRDAERRE